LLSDIHNLPSIKETIWCTQKAMAVLFDVGIPAMIKKTNKNINTEKPVAKCDQSKEVVAKCDHPEEVVTNCDNQQITKLY